MTWASPLGLFDVHDERLVLRRLRVCIAHEGRQRVGQIALLRHTLEAPVIRYADRVHLGTVAIERLDALGNYRDGLDLATVGTDSDPIPGLDTLFFGQLLTNLDELLRLGDRVEKVVL